MSDPRRNFGSVPGKIERESKRLDFSTNLCSNERGEPKGARIMTSTVAMTSTAARANTATTTSTLASTGPRPGVPVTAANLLHAASRGLAEAAAETSPGIRYICAHLAALRAAAAIVAAREPAGRRRRGPRSVWELLPQVEPALGEWAAFFAASASKRAAVEAGLLRAASAHEADDLLRDATIFLGVAERALGLEIPPQLPLRSAS
jgi:hypothetical protein